MSLFFTLVAATLVIAIVVGLVWFFWTRKRQIAQEAARQGR
jgi:cbb3-type cytochrome oxidase subunit 3